MADKVNRELYSFNIDVEREEEREITKEVKRKNKKTGKMETREESVIRTVKKNVPVRVSLRKPSRTQIEDGDMFYSIWLNKYIKMGLLTRAMLAKKQVDVGGTLNEDDKMNYAKLYLQLFEKQQNIMRYSAKDQKDMSVDEKGRLDNAVSQLAVIRKQLADFEAAQASIFDHTADVKARNKTITWFLLHLTHVEEGEGDEEETDVVPMFPGSDYEEKYRSYQEADEEQDEIFLKAIDRLSTVATIWYMSGVQDQSEFDTVLQQIEKDSGADISGTSEGVGVAPDSAESSENESAEEEADSTEDPPEEDPPEEDPPEEDPPEEDPPEEDPPQEEVTPKADPKPQAEKKPTAKKRGRPKKKAPVNEG